MKIEDKLLLAAVVLALVVGGVMIHWLNEGIDPVKRWGPSLNVCGDTLDGSRGADFVIDDNCGVEIDVYHSVGPATVYRSPAGGPEVVIRLDCETTR